MAVEMAQCRMSRPNRLGTGEEEESQILDGSIDPCVAAPVVTERAELWIRGGAAPPRRVELSLFSQVTLKTCENFRTLVEGGDYDGITLFVLY